MRDDIFTFLPAIRIYARALCGNGGDPDQLVQETLIEAIANFDDFRPGTDMRAWLCKIMRSSFHANADGEPAGCKPALPHGQFYDDRLFMALDDLPGECRELVSLILINGESPETAADITGYDIPTIENCLESGRRELHNRLTLRDAY